MTIEPVDEHVPPEGDDRTESEGTEVDRAHDGRRLRPLPVRGGAAGADLPDADPAPEQPQQ